MNERVSIKEGGLTRELSPIDKVKANNTDGTQSIWVSKDDMHTGTLYATENGIYIASEDGYDAYDEVLIRVTDESYDGSNTWKDVDPDEDRYTWDDTTYQDYKIDPDSFDDKFNDPTKWEDEDLGDNLDYKYNDGNSISGIDPETGGKVEYSVDEDGFLDEEYIPWTIEITRLPDRTEFYDGHRIVFSGIEVSALTTNADGGDTYTPIPYNELIFPVRMAVFSQSEGAEEVDVSGTGLNAPVFGNSVGIDTVTSRWTDPDEKIKEIEGNPTVYGFDGGTGVSEIFVWISDQPWKVLAGRRYAMVDYNRWIIGEETTKGDYSAYVAVVAPASQGMTYFTVGAAQDDPVLAAMIAYFDCPVKSTQVVPVQWISPDGFALEDSYTITVFPDPSGGGDDGGSEGGDTVDQDGRFSWNGKNYKLNDSLAAEVHYANGNVWIEGISTDYTVGQAVDLNLVIPV